MYCGHFGVKSLNFIFSLVSLPEPEAAKENKHLKTYPENRVCLLSKLCFWWINDLISAGYSRELNLNDMWHMEDKESSKSIAKRLETEWGLKVEEYTRQLDHFKCMKEEYMRKKIGQYGSIQDSVQTTVSKYEDRKVKRPSFGWTLVRCFHGKFLGGSLLRLVNDLMNFVGPVILDKLISFLKDREQAQTVGVCLACLLFLNFSAQSFLLQHTQHRNFVVGARLRTSIMNIIYKKVKVV